MRYSPCIGCELRDQDKNNTTCLHCTQRMEYVNSMGCDSESLPWEMTDMVQKKPPAWSSNDEEFLKDNFLTMRNRKLAEELDRTEKAVTLRLNKLKLSRLSKNRPAKVENQVDDKTILDKQKHITHQPIITPPMTYGPPSVEKLPMNPSKDFIIIDFSKYGDLYNDLIEASAENFRTPELQILFYCQQAINEIPGK